MIQNLSSMCVEKKHYLKYIEFKISVCFRYQFYFLLKKIGLKQK
jgi:hypothetical protein